MFHDFFLAFNYRDNFNISNLQRETEEITDKIIYPPAPTPTPSGDTDIDMNDNMYVLGGY